MSENPVTAAPEMISAGEFALYKTPRGGMHLVLQVQGEGEPRHIEVPALMLKAMSARMRFGGG